MYVHWRHGVQQVSWFRWRRCSVVINHGGCRLRFLSLSLLVIFICCWLKMTSYYELTDGFIIRLKSCSKMQKSHHVSLYCSCYLECVVTEQTWCTLCYCSNHKEHFGKIYWMLDWCVATAEIKSHYILKKHYSNIECQPNVDVSALNMRFKIWEEQEKEQLSMYTWLENIIHSNINTAWFLQKVIQSSLGFVGFILCHGRRVCQQWLKSTLYNKSTRLVASVLQSLNFTSLALFL